MDQQVIITLASAALAAISFAAFALPFLKKEEKKERMKAVLKDIQDGRFARDWILENNANQASFKAIRANEKAHPIESVGQALRGQMDFQAHKRPEVIAK